MSTIEPNELWRRLSAAIGVLSFLTFCTTIAGGRHVMFGEESGRSKAFEGFGGYGRDRAASYPTAAPHDGSQDWDGPGPGGGSNGAMSSSGSSGSWSGDSRPVFRQTPKNVTVGPGDRAVLKCRVDNLGTRTVTWKRLEDVHPLTIGLFPFAPDARIAIDLNQRTNEWSLIIQDIRPMDEGIYQCQISTKNDHDSYDIMLNVRTVQVTGGDYVERGSPIQLVCNASGRPDPPTDVDWFKDDDKTPIRQDPQAGVLVTKKIEPRYLVSMLSIRSSRMTDSGDYMCRASSRDFATINVNVFSVPVEKRGTAVEKRMSAARSTSHSTSAAAPVTKGGVGINSCLLVALLTLALVASSCGRHRRRLQWLLMLPPAVDR